MSELDSLVIVRALWQEAQTIHVLHCIMERAEQQTIEFLGDVPRDSEFCNWVMSHVDMLAAGNECCCTNCRCECRNCQSWQYERSLGSSSDRDEERMAWA